MYFQIKLVSTLWREIEFVTGKLIDHLDSKLLYFSFFYIPKLWKEHWTCVILYLFLWILVWEQKVLVLKYR